jgi:hypothetical protein
MLQITAHETGITPIRTYDAGVNSANTKSPEPVFRAEAEPVEIQIAEIGQIDRTAAINIGWDAGAAIEPVNDKVLQVFQIDKAIIKARPIIGTTYACEPNRP